MNRRTFAILALGLSLVTTPVLAQKKDAAAPAPAPMSAAVNPDPAFEPENILVLDLSNGGRVMLGIRTSWQSDPPEPPVLDTT